jgi:hypothetical protein
VPSARFTNPKKENFKENFKGFFCFYWSQPKLKALKILENIVEDGKFKNSNFIKMLYNVTF